MRRSAGLQDMPPGEAAGLPISVAAALAALPPADCCRPPLVSLLLHLCSIVRCLRQLHLQSASLLHASLQRTGRQAEATTKPAPKMAWILLQLLRSLVAAGTTALLHALLLCGTCATFNSWASSLLLASSCCSSMPAVTC